MNCVVVDDEGMMLEALCQMIRRAGADVAGAYQDPLEALESVRTLRPDVLFLDVEMPGMNGIELAQRVGALDSRIQIVFVTAYEQYAIKAFELGAIHYVLKPVTDDKIGKAITRVGQVQAMRRPRGPAADPAFAGMPGKAADRLSVKVRDDIIVIKLKDIVFLKAEQGKTILYTKDGNYTSADGLGFWETKLPSGMFIRCHRGYIVNTSYIRRMAHILGEYRELVLADCDLSIPVSRQRVAAVKRWMGIQ